MVGRSIRMPSSQYIAKFDLLFFSKQHSDISYKSTLSVMKLLIQSSYSLKNSRGLSRVCIALQVVGRSSSSLLPSSVNIE